MSGLTTSKQAKQNPRQNSISVGHRDRSKVSSSSSSPASPGGAGINLDAILKARQHLKPSAFGRALGQGEVSNTTDEMACLIRSGAKETSSLTRDGANFLRKRFEHIKEVTEQSDSESDTEEWD